MESASERFVKLVWTECDRNGNEEPHVARGALVNEVGDHFVLRVNGGRLLYISKKATLKMIDEGGVRQ